MGLNTEVGKKGDLSTDVGKSRGSKQRCRESKHRCRKKAGDLNTDAGKSQGI